MPQSGEQNKEFGIYKSVCCGFEIVISIRAIFPRCPNHPDPPTAWIPLEEGNYPTEKRNRSESDSAA